MRYPDIFFTPEYLKLFEKTGFGGKWDRWQSGNDKRSIIYNYYVRPIPNTEYFDIVSPYGYSGPLATTEDKKVWSNFVRDFHDACLDNKIVSEFARLHPFIENHIELEPNYLFQGNEVYYLDLTQLIHLNSRCRSHIKQAEKAGITITQKLVPEVFYDLYIRTMERNKAESEYYFKRTFFHDLMELPNAMMFSAELDHRIIASRIILIHGDYAHDFLAASDYEHGNSSASNLIISEAIKWAKEKGCKIFNLGGAKSENHAKFKQSFTQLSKPFYTYRKIHNQAVYDEFSKEIQTDYFPAYRSLGRTLIQSYKDDF